MILFKQFYLLLLLVSIILVPVIFLSSCRTSVDFPCDFQGREYEREAGKAVVDQEVEEAGKQEVLSFPTGIFKAGIMGNEKIIEVTRSNPGYGKTVLGINTESTNLFAIAYSPDGKIIASGGNDMVVKLWDTETGNLIRKLVNHTGFVYSLTFSHDGKLLVSGSADTNIVIWNVTSGEVIKVLTDHAGVVFDVEFSPDGKLLASGSWDITIKIWNTVDWTEVETFTDHDKFVVSVHFSPDGKLLASGSDDRTLKFWNTTSWELNSTTVFPQLISAVRFSPDGKYFATGCWTGTSTGVADLRLYDVESMTYDKLEGHVNGIGFNAIDFSPDGKLLATGSWDETVRLWNVTTKQRVKVLAGHVGRVNGVAFSPDGTMIAAGGMDGIIWLWNVASGAEEGEFIGHESTVYTVVFSPDGQTLASGSYDNNIILWNVTTGDKMLPLAGHDAAVHSVAFSPDGKLLVSGSWDTTVRLWNVTEGKELPVSPLTHHTDAVRPVIFSLDGTVVISGSISPERAIRLWNVTSEKELQLISPLIGHGYSVSSLALSPDGLLLASGSWDSTIKIWNITSGQLLRTLTGHVGQVLSVAFSPDGDLLASGGWDNTVRIWNVTNGQSWVLGGQGGGIESIAFSPDGKLIAAGSIKGTIRLWNVSSGEETPVKTIHVPATAVFSVTFSPDGKILASGDNDGIIRLWNVNLIPDGDWDGMPDDWESAHGLDPLDFWDKFDDPDDDGLINSLEQFHGTSPLERDSDGDGMPDGWEHLSGVDPAFPDDDDDKDGDVITALYEFQTGLDPWHGDGAGDKDGDGLTNLQEFQYGSWADRVDSDLDGMPDGFEYEHGLEPLSDDSRLDKDNDFMSNIYEYLHEFDATNASDAGLDKDGDRMINQYEAIHGFNATNASDANDDKDKDGIDNWYEAVHGLNASNASDAGVDSDGDWVINVQEFRGSTDPNDPWSFPVLSFSVFHAVVVILLLITVFAAFSYFLNDRRKKQLALTARLKAPDYPTALKIQKSGYGSHQVFIEAGNDAKAMVNEANALFYQGEPVKAIQTHEQALTVFERLDDKLSKAATIFWIARIQKERQELIADSAILKLFPQPQRDEPVIESIDHMVKALLAEAKKNWGLANEAWQAALAHEGLDEEFKLFCQGATIEYEVRTWLDNPVVATLEPITIQLNEWENACKINKQFGNLCQAYLVHARVALASSQFEEMENWLKKCLQIAEEKELEIYQDIVRTEKEEFLYHKERMSSILEAEKPVTPEEQIQLLQEYIKTALSSLEREKLK